MADPDLEEIVQLLLDARRLAASGGWPALVAAIEQALNEASRISGQLCEADERAVASSLLLSGVPAAR
ncbi:MAG TPA: hypothetical protein VKV77_03560 [Methylovirgula sp.]|nr:hypothetical protein [Methylovirgula sp.]